MRRLLRYVFPSVGTRSVLFGAHQFLLHPLFVARAWTILYGFPWDYRLWFSFFLHDLGYLGKKAMDDADGETHPELGARIMGRLFDRHPEDRCKYRRTCSHYDGMLCPCEEIETNRESWHDFCIYHSRYYAKKHGARVSKLCFADKLSFAVTPRWLYLPMVNLTGEIDEYLHNAQKADSANWTPTGYDQKKWHRQLCDYMTTWVYEHLDGRQDTWTSRRH